MKGHTVLATTSFGDVIWFIIISYLFISYLVIFFTVVGDLFRDRETSGIMKFLWILLLIWLPFLSVLVYLLVRGRGMAERSASQQRAAQEQFNSYVRDAAGTNSAASELASAKALLDSGAIDAAEYDQLKKKILG
jgi:hypothetical protein